MTTQNPFENSFRKRLQARQPLLGCWASLASATGAEALGLVGFDWLLLDGEHAPNDVSTLLDQLRAVTGSPSAAVVRPAAVDPVEIKQLLDIGVENFLMPLVDNAELARLAVAATRYPPQGLRGVAVVQRASGYGTDRDYFRRANQQVAVVVQIESSQAIENVEAIANVDGVDGLFVGPADLSASLGHFMQPEHPTVQAAIARVILAAQSAGKSVGILEPVVEQAQRYLAQGMNLLAVGGDIGLMVQAGRRRLEQVRKGAQSDA